MGWGSWLLGWGGTSWVGDVPQGAPPQEHGQKTITHTWLTPIREFLERECSGLSQGTLQHWG